MACYLGTAAAVTVAVDQTRTEQEAADTDIPPIGSVDGGSSTSSDESVIEDQRCVDQDAAGRRKQRGGRFHRRWKPSRYPFLSTRTPHRSDILNSILQREHYSGDYIGDNIGLEEASEAKLRVCTVNINKQYRRKMEEELAGWIVANEIDFAIISDPAIPSQRLEQIWVSDLDSQRPVPSLMLVGSGRIALVFDNERWGNRVLQHSVRYSPSRRSMCAEIRLAKARKLWLIGTYIHHAPDQHEDAVHTEWEWIQQRVNDGRTVQATIIVAGDFNTYPDEDLDRTGTSSRSQRAQNTSRQFAEWTRSIGIVSSFRSRHPATRRHTYARNGVSSALDDIYVSGEHESAISSSAVWLNSIISSDHVGVPVAVLQCGVGSPIAYTLQNATPIKVVNTRKKTTEDMIEFSKHTDNMIASGDIKLIEDIDEETSSPEQVCTWLNNAIENMYSCLYTSARTLWGETTQSRRQLARAVCIKRSNRCTAQLRLTLELTCQNDVSAGSLRMAVEAICWPKWILDPSSMVPGCAHYETAVKLTEHITDPPSTENAIDWIRWTKRLHKLWRKTMRVRRNWRHTSRRHMWRDRRRNWFVSGSTRQFLRNTLGKPAPPVSIRSAIIHEEGGAHYTENRTEVQHELTNLLDNWIPADEKTIRPKYLDTRLPEDIPSFPEFAREWILPDIEGGGRYSATWNQPGHSWDDYHYTADMQNKIDGHLKLHVAPGFGGISQEMWIQAPATVRERERRVIELILRTGVAPKILRRKQMIFLPKAQIIDSTLDVSKGLPPWRPITIQSSFANRLFLVVKSFVDTGIASSPLQHGFRGDRSVIDAALLTTLLIERAKELRELLILVSKDCLKCYDRIPAWVMELLYLGMGVPDPARRLMIDFLGPGEITVRTAFGWLSAGDREFGIGQGSILAILHIGVYMDCLQERLTKCADAVKLRYHQAGGGIDIGSTMFVDDQLDVSTTYTGVLERAKVTNLFTGKFATGGVFGSTKSFQMYLSQSNEHFPAIQLNDGHGIPRQVQIVAPAEGFKHLGIFQGGEDQWAASLEPTWQRLTADAARIQRLDLSLPELRYVVNRIWIPRLRYRMILGGAISMAEKVDTFIRQVARTVLRLPFSLNKGVYYDKANGLGLESCEADANTQRLVEALRVLNSPELPVYHALVERLEAYQIRTGLTENPLACPIRPPPRARTWTAQLIRYAASFDPPLQMAIEWTQPPKTRSKRENDRPIIDITPPELRPNLVAINWKYSFKLQYVGDITSNLGLNIIPLPKVLQLGGWKGKDLIEITTLYSHWRQALTIDGTNRLRSPVGCTPLASGDANFHLRVGVGQWIVAVTINTAEAVTVVGHHEIGYREIGDIGRDQLGITIPIRWWYERPRGSDIWYERTHRRIEDEYEAVCVPITATYLPESSAGRQRVILWSTTDVNGVRGANDKQVLEEALARSRLRYISTLQYGRTLDAVSSCSVCGRLREAQWCRRCGQWHHPQCVRGTCQIRHDGGEEVLQVRSDAVRYCWDSDDATVPVAAGDGSVIHADTPSASGTWAMRQPAGPMVTGRLVIHQKDITSTRCEVHALIAGLIASGDTGEQVCDNKSAIHIFAKARDLSIGRLHHIKYRDPHRIEIRSLAKHMQVGGTMSPKWVRSHQESLPTPDDDLHRRREALATVDMACGAAHDQPILETYESWIVFDAFMLKDEEDCLVFGNVARYLNERHYTDSRRKVIATQRQRDETRHTIAEDELVMLAQGQWSPALCRFYWRAKSIVLHTNAVKHRFDKRWPATCVNCVHGTLDTQHHRFGVSEPACTDATTLTEMLRSQYDDLERKILLPDQALLIPAVGHDIGKTMASTSRATWRDTGAKAALWEPMVMLENSIWVNAQWLEWFDEPEIMCSNPEFVTAIQEEQAAKTSPTDGRIIPMQVIDIVRLSHPMLGLHAAYPGQWTPGWASVTFAGALNHSDFRNLHVAEPAQVHSWWVDDVYIPHSKRWWEHFASAREENTFWVATYENSEGHLDCSLLGCKWVVRLPAGALAMRTDCSVIQTSYQESFRATYAKNPRAISIGVIESPTSTLNPLDDALPIWATVLHRLGVAAWLIQAPSSPRAEGSIRWKHPLFEWYTPSSDTARTPVWWSRVRQQLDRLELSMLTAPSGWKRYPTMTRQSEQWARAVSYTAKGARLLHAHLFRDIWQTLHRYWKLTCDRCGQAIRRRRRRTALLQLVNRRIVQRRRERARNPQDSVTRAFGKRRAVLQARSRRWFVRRNQHLPDGSTGSA